MKMDKGMHDCCVGGSCHRCWGMMALIVGALILLNVYYIRFDWAVFIGGLFVLKGLVKLVWPHCPHC